MLAKGRETPLEAKVVVLCLFILNKILILLINRVIRQMHVSVILVELGGVGFRGKTGKAFLIDIEPQRLIASHDHVYSKIKFVAVD